MRNLYRLPDPSDTGRAALRRLCAGYLLLLTAIAWLITQLCAYRLRYAVELGPPWLALPQPSRVYSLLALGFFGLATVAVFRPRLRRLALVLALAGVALATLASGPLYTPLHFFFWAHRFRHPLLVAHLWRPGYALFGASGVALLVAFVVHAARRLSAFSQPADIHGSARWATASDLRTAGLVQPFEGKGLFLGRDPNSKSGYLRDDSPSHVFVFAPTRSGKGVGLVIPNLLTWPHSVLVHDIKSENWSLTAGHRATALGNRCLRFDPTAAIGASARYNPLDGVRRDTHDVRDAQQIADILVDPNGDRLRDHWDRTAWGLLTGVVLHVLYSDEATDKTLSGCASLLSDPERSIDDTLHFMRTAQHSLEPRADWGGATTHPLVAGTARTMLDRSSEERSSVLSTALSFLDLYRDPIIAHHTALSDFQLQDLMVGERPLSLYLAVPPSDLSRTRPLVRMLLNQTLRRLTEPALQFRNGQPVPHYDHPLLLMLDEFPALGRLPFFQESLAYVAGYGIRAVLITQDLAQHYGAYGSQESITGNCAVRIAYAANKPETARLLSDMCGKMTVHFFHRSLPGAATVGSDPRSFTTQDTGRALLTPDEAMRLPRDEELVFITGLPPIRAPKIRYYRDPRFARLASVSPPPPSERKREGAGGFADEVQNGGAP